MFNKAVRFMAVAGVLASAAIATVGCDAGDENPVTPEKMEQIRNQTNEQRANFKPDSSQRPGG